MSGNYQSDIVYANSDLSSGEKAGIGVGVDVAVLGIISIILCLREYYRRKSEAKIKEQRSTRHTTYAILRGLGPLEGR
jgi:hypothetical protein